MNTYAIGDLHGHYDQWLRLYKKLLDQGLHPEQDVLVFLGDYVDGGDQVKQTLNWLIEHKKKYPHWQMIYGNHEDLMLDALVYNGRIYHDWNLWWSQGGRQTARSYFPEGLTQYEKALLQVKDYIPFDHLDWLRQLPLYWEDDKYFFVHAGLVPGITIEEHKKRLEHGGGILYDEFKQNMIWIRGHFHRSDYDWGKKIIFGHTTFKKPFIKKNMIGIDAMFHDIGDIIAVKLPDETFIIESSQLEA